MDTGSTVPRRQLGRYLRDLREGSRLTVAAVARSLDWSPQRIWRYETGQVPMARTDVEAMCRRYAAPAETTELLTALAAETKSKGWWHAYERVVPEWFKLFVGLESAAEHIRWYSDTVVPGLLQTVEYMTEVIALDVPHLSVEERREKVAVRIRRQALLARALPPAPRLDVILSEAVLRRPLRDRAAMARQLGHLLAAGERHNVTVRVLPLAAGLHRWAAAGSFAVLDFPREGVRAPEPTTVYADGPAGAYYLDKPREIDEYEGIWASLDGLALSEERSGETIARLAREYDDER
jgi:transcriptional regulator with XRE-family HTH domain